MELALKADEGSTYIITVSFTDDTGAAVTPTSATWTLTDSEGDIVNERDGVAITELSTSNDIVMYGADTAVSNDIGNRRVLTVEAVYDSDAGTDLPMKGEIEFSINDLLNVG